MNLKQLLSTTLSLALVTTAVAADKDKADESKPPAPVWIQEISGSKIITIGPDRQVKVQTIGNEDSPIDLQQKQLENAVVEAIGDKVAGGQMATAKLVTFEEMETNQNDTDKQARGSIIIIGPDGKSQTKLTFGPKGVDGKVIAALISDAMGDDHRLPDNVRKSLAKAIQQPVAIRTTGQQPKTTSDQNAVLKKLDSILKRIGKLEKTVAELN